MPADRIRRGASAPALILFGACLCLGSPARAAPPDPFPKFDIERICATGPGKDNCKTLERKAESDLRARWPSLPAARQARCARVGAEQGGSYLAALGCASGN